MIIKLNEYYIKRCSLNYNASNNSKISKINSGSILVLDDDFEITTLIKIALQRHGYDVFGFTDPFLALEHFKINHSTYSLVISDLRMPSMSGFQFIQNIKLIRPKINVLLMSAFDVIGHTEFYTQ